MKIRIKFAKYGTMKFIGHLDVMRFFQKAIRRAQIDIRYSEGFSPHQIMSFAAPLGVGLESTGEYLDIEVNSVTSTKDIKNALNNVMVEGMEILSVKALPDTAKNAMASVAAARYRIVCRQSALPEPVEDIVQKLSAFYAQKQIPVTKKTKKSMLELDLKPGIYELTTEECADPDKKGENCFVVSMLVDASSSGNIKPAMVLDAFFSYCHIEPSPYAYQIMRVETYTDVHKEGEERVLIPLDEAGSDFP